MAVGVSTQGQPALKRYGLYIDGKFVEPASGESVASINPTTGEAWYELADAGARDVSDAVAAARRALDDPAWRDLKPVARAAMLRRIGDGLREHGDELAQVETTDNGKLIREVRAQVRAMPALWDYFAGWCDKLHGDIVPSEPTTLNMLRREPVGVVAVISPWNSPLNIAFNKIAPALAAGNTVVAKPSEHTSASLLESMLLFEEAGVPPGVVNVVTGLGSSAGSALVSHPDIDLISFTGGSETGRRIAAMAAQRPVRSIMELGGKSPNIVFADADLDRAAYGVIAGIFAACGETCVAGSRCFVESSVYDEILARVESRVKTIRLGNPLEDSTDVGPVAFRAHMERVLNYIEIGVSEGATVRVGGGRATDEGLASGFFVQPTILEDVSNDSRVAREEIFGPVLAIAPFSDEQAVLRAANDTPFGLAAGVWTSNLTRAHRVAQRLDAGTVWVNTYRAMSPLSPFGGFKQSGYGKENGMAGMLEYTRQKSIWIDLSEGPAADPFVMRL